jgi:transcription termination factor Rho
MSVLDRESLEQSPLADLHTIASELSLDGYRRLRKGELIDAILAKQSGEEPAGAVDSDADGDDERPAKRRRGRRGGRGRSSAKDDADDEPSAKEADDEPSAKEADAEPDAAEPKPEPVDKIVEGEVDLLPNGSGFVRVNPPEPSDDDVYISAAQVKRCELVSGDRIAGPRRAPRRSERFASLVRIDTINGRPADEVAAGARFDDLPAAFPQERFKLGSEDPTVKAIEWLTPFGKGSRVAIVGASRAGKSEALRRLGEALASHDDVQLLIALAGIRPEEFADWTDPACTVGLGVSPDAQAHAIELVLDHARRAAARGGDAVVLIDTLDGLTPPAARKATSAARNIVDGGSLTVVATAQAPVGGETTVIALDAVLASTGHYPALDMVASGTLRPELLVGDAGAAAIARAREMADDDQ